MCNIFVDHKSSYAGINSNELMLYNRQRPYTVDLTVENLGEMLDEIIEIYGIIDCRGSNIQASDEFGGNGNSAEMVVHQQITSLLMQERLWQLKRWKYTTDVVRRTYFIIITGLEAWLHASNKCDEDDNGEGDECHTPKIKFARFIHRFNYGIVPLTFYLTQILELAWT